MSAGGQNHLQMRTIDKALSDYHEEQLFVGEVIVEAKRPIMRLYCDPAREDSGF